ncbi:hypothetical protein CKO12_12445 [Chromatium okenii]|uniref:Eco57I restriction-modification methylase domain-containing protein n=1 Tax=Chromatium okenii TaxID=61644 RepID=UPI0019053323|nr:DNA methyltransferase [Chromatium okenii]MBK1642666.1 hypothetical protein [Chromatium okenii]
MDALQIERLREHLQGFNFPQLFIEELGWSQVQGQQHYTVNANQHSWEATAVAEFAGMVVFVINKLPALADVRLLIQRELSQVVHENVLIFTDSHSQVWMWVKREGTRLIPREHWYLQGQSGDLFLSKLSSIMIDINDLDAAGNFPLTALIARMQAAFDVERVTKKFFDEYKEQHEQFSLLIAGVDAEAQRNWLASILIHRLMFIWFLQRKHFLDGGNGHYLRDKLLASQQRGAEQFYSGFLQALFFEGFAKPPEQRSAATQQLIGDIRFLNGGLFLPHRLETLHQDSLHIPDVAFSQLFTFFQRYSWHLNDTPGGQDDEINPDVLGYIFEKYINQRKSFGAYYTRPQITEYLCERTIHGLILQHVQHLPLAVAPVGGAAPRQFNNLHELLTHLNAQQCAALLELLPTLKLLDPACGSGAFLVAAMKTLIGVYEAIIGRIPFLKDRKLKAQLDEWKTSHASVSYFIRRTIITNNLFGVEIVEEAVEIAKLRLFLALVATAESVEQLEPLPNIDFNIVTGNSLIGLMQVDAAEFANKNPAGSLALSRSYREIVNEKNRFIKIYRDTVAGFGGVNLSQIKHDIELNQAEAQPVLNEILLTKMGACAIRFEQATWDAAKNKMGKTIKRPLKTADIAALHPFHWGFEFNQVLEAGGFHAIITNPPWEIVKPNAKEFFQEHSELVTKNKMTIKEFEKAQDQLLADVTIREEWLAYLSNFAHQSAWFRAAPQFKFQSAIVNGKKTGSDINLYKLFTEQCVNLLRPGGACGIVIPSGIYTDLGAKGLRDLLFHHTQISGLFCFENRKDIFEGVDSRFKFVILTFEKGGTTTQFPATFMRHHLAELATFPNITSLQLSVDLIRRLSPDSHSVMEFKSATDVQIAEKLLKFPLLGEKIENTWNLRLTREFDMTNDSHLFKTEAGAGRLPLFEGKHFHQFTADYGQPKYWLNEDEARDDLIAARVRKAKKLVTEAAVSTEIQPEMMRLNYESYRLAFRDVARNTDERTFIGTILASGRFCPHTVSLESVFFDAIENEQIVYNCTAINHQERVFLIAILNSFTVDYLFRQCVTSHVSFFFVYNIPVPRLTAADPVFLPIVHRAAKLICTTPEFDQLAAAVGLESHHHGVTAASERAQLRAELDALIAHLYGLSEAEFAHILATFPLVAAEIKAAALAAYRVSCDN